MELYWEIVSCVNEILLMAVIGYLYYRFVKPFLNKSRYVCFVGIVYFAVMLVLYMSYGMLHIDGWVAGVIDMAAVFAVMCMIDRRNFRQKVFLAIIMYLIEWMSGGIELIVINSLFEYALLPISDRPVLQFVIYIMIEIVDVVLSYFVMAYLFRIVDKAYICKREDMSRKELGLMLAAPLSVLMGHMILKFSSGVYEKDMNQYIWNTHSGYLWITALYQLVSFVAIMAAIVIYQNIKESHRNEKENAILSEQIEHTKRHMKEVERLYCDIRSLRHDMGNHVATLEHLFLKNEAQETEQYLQRLKEQLNEITPEFRSGNPITDVILTEKQKEAREKGIDFRCNYHYPTKTGIDAFDVSVILNNALANAIEGASMSKNPYVSISSYINKNAYMIEIKNSFEKRLEINEESGLPETTKGDEESHGFGLLNIRKVARKYSGDIDIGQDGKNFLLSIMLMLN